MLNYLRFTTKMGFTERYFGKKLVIGAINYDSLKYAIGSVFISNLWDNYKNKYKEYIHHDNLASKRFAEFLMSL